MGRIVTLVNQVLVSGGCTEESSRMELMKSQMKQMSRGMMVGMVGAGTRVASNSDSWGSDSLARCQEGED